MTFFLADRAMETSTTTGTGTLTLLGAVTGFQSVSVIGNGNTCPYSIVGIDANKIPTGEWETGTGTYTSSGTTLARSVKKSSNSNALVNFSAGTKLVFVDLSSVDYSIVGAANSIPRTGSLTTLDATWLPPTTVYTTTLSTDLYGIIINSGNIGAFVDLGIALKNPTAATAGSQQWSTALFLEGQAWGTGSGGASHAVDWAILTIGIQGVSPTAKLSFQYTLDNGTYVEKASIDSTGLFTITTLTVTSTLTTAVVEGLNLVNLTLATSGSKNRDSPGLHFGGYGWTTVNVNVDWLIKLSIEDHAPSVPTASLIWYYRTSTNAYASVLILNSDGTITAGGSVTATSFIGAGSLITSINASNISSGTIAAARLPQSPGTILGVNYVSTDESTASTTSVDLTTADTVTFTLTATTTVMVMYTANCYQSAGTVGFNNRSTVNYDGTDDTTTNNDVASSALSRGAICAAYGTKSLAAGTHTIKVVHAMPNGGTGHWRSRLLTIYAT